MWANNIVKHIRTFKMTKTITVAYGDGIGPEIMDSTLEILKEAKADLKFNIIEVGQKIYMITIRFYYSSYY